MIVYVPYNILNKDGLLNLEGLLKCLEEVQGFYDSQKVIYDHKIYIGEYFIKVIFIVYGN